MSKVHNIFAVDFCQTLVNIDSLPCFIKFVCLEAKGKRTFLYVWFWLLMRLGFNVSKDSRIKLISGVESTLLSSLTERFHREVLVPNINYKVIDFIHKKRIEGDKVIIVSAAISDYILYFAKEFDFEFIIAAKLEQKNDIATGELNEPLVYGSLKVDKLKELFIDLELQHYNIVGISDSIHDLPLLEWCNDPVVILDVCPELTKVGRERQWELL